MKIKILIGLLILIFTVVFISGCVDIIFTFSHEKNVSDGRNGFLGNASPDFA